jgi:glutamine cyclotransferase
MTQMISGNTRKPRWIKPGWMTIAAAALALTSGLGVSAAAFAQSMTTPQVRARLAEQGYTKIHDLEFKDGMWHADAKSADGNDVDVRIDPATGKVYPEEEVSKLSEADVRASLSTQGYTDVHDVDFDDGIWKAKAKNAVGNKVELRLDPASGKVIGTD